MRLTLLGTGNAAGIPRYGCPCEHCHAARHVTGLQRGPCSAVLELGAQRYLIDAGRTDLAERFPAGTLSGIFLTHFHADHVQGLLHLRWGTGQHLPVYTPPDSEGCADLYKHPGILDFHPLRKFETFRLGDLRITPLPLIHSKPTFGYLFEHTTTRIAYLTDTRGLPPKTLQWLQGHKPKLLVVDTSYPPGTGHGQHNDLDETLALHRNLESPRTVLTHIGHDLNAWLVDHAHTLPPGVHPGGDGDLVFPYCDST